MRVQHRKLSKLFFICSALLALCHLSGCATIFTGTTDTVKFDSNVPGVRMSIDGEYKGELPLTLTLSRNFMNGQSFKAKFQADGYETQEFTIKREFNTVAVLDISSIVTSGGIDLLTGSLMRFSPNEYHVQMLKIGEKADSAEYERSIRLYRYALVNFEHVQRDIVSGGGEYLTSLSKALSGERRDVQAMITAQVLQNSSELVSSSDAHEFVRRLNNVLSDQPELRDYRI